MESGWLMDCGKKEAMRGEGQKRKDKKEITAKIKEGNKCRISSPPYEY